MRGFKKGKHKDTSRNRKHLWWKIVVGGYIILSFFQKAPVFREHVRFFRIPKISLPKINTCLWCWAERGDFWRSTSWARIKKVAWRTSVPEIFCQHRAHRGTSQWQTWPKAFNILAAKNQNLKKKHGKRIFPHLLPNLYYLQQSPPKRTTGRWRFTAVCCATHPKAVFESPVGSNKKKLCGMGSGIKSSQRKKIERNLSQQRLVKT